MKAIRRIPFLLALTSVSTLAFAQVPKPAQTGGAATRPVSAPKAQADTPERTQSGAVLLHVSGLTKENVAAVRSELNGLTEQSYVCEKCQHRQANPGACPSCKAELRPEKKQILSRVEPVAEAETIAIQPAAGLEAKLSTIERALGKSSVRVDENRLELAGNPTLILQDADASNIPALEKALRDAKLFESVTARYDAKAKEIAVAVRAAPKPAARSAVVHALESSGTKAKLMDVVWGARPVGS